MHVIQVGIPIFFHQNFAPGEAAGSYDQAASLYILDTNFEAAAPLMAKISTPKLHLQFAKAKESRGSYQDRG